jgi:hypothetical protein
VQADSAISEVEVLPKSITVAELLESRYPDNNRPDSWDYRVAGHDRIKASDGKIYCLFSDGQQSPPQAGSTLILRALAADQRSAEGAAIYSWTLHGIAKH